MNAYAELQTRLRGGPPRTWLVTGVAGFIGSHLLETLLTLDQRVVGLDNFATGHRHNLEQVRDAVGRERWARFAFIEGDIRTLADCRRACQGVEFVLHQAALGSVPRSLEDPVATHDANLTGFLHMLVAARDAGAARFVYASSSAVYGDHPGLPKEEAHIVRPLSPYAVTKRVNEEYADVFALAYGFQGIGLRYFNVFGPRQDPNGAYAAVVPAWTAAMIRNAPLWINGDGETSRDFCYVANVVQANLLAATVPRAEAVGQVYNVAVGGRTTLNDLYAALHAALLPRCPHLAGFAPRYRDFRPGDVRHSLADITRARTLLGYAPSHTLAEGLMAAMDWYVAHLQPAAKLTP